MSITLNQLFIIIPLTFFFLRIVYVDLKPKLEGYALFSAIGVSTALTVLVLSSMVMSLSVMLR